MAEQIQRRPEKRRNKRRRRLWRRALLFLLIFLLLGGAGLYIFSSLKQKYAVNYTGYTAATGSISNSLSFSGSVSLVNSQTCTAEADTTVRALYVKAGDEVKTGDRLVRLENGKIFKADFDGRVNTVSVETGDAVTTGDALVQLADFHHMKVNIRVDEYDISNVRAGEMCRITATATEQTFESRIAAIDYISASTGNVAYYTATAYLDVEEGIYPGMQATVTIPKEEAQNVVVLKMDALSFDAANSAFVFMRGSSGELEKRYVEVGVSNGNYVEIKSGLASGDEVYVETKAKEESSGGLFSALFGSQQMTPPSNMRNRERDFSNFNPGSMPGGGNMPGGGFGGGNR